MTNSARRALAVLTALPAVLWALLLLGAAPASAHASLLSATPAQGSQVAQAPATVTLTFSEDVGLGDRVVEVVDPRGRRVDDGHPVHPDGQGHAVRVGLREGLGTGSYGVTWRVVSVDGHPVAGTFAFGVGVPAGTVDEAVAVDPLVGAVRTAAQLAGYLGAAVLVGASAFVFVLWPDGFESARLRRLVVLAVGVAGAGSVVSVLVQGAYVTGGTLAAVADPQTMLDTVNSGYGRPLLLRVLAVALAVPLLGIWPRLPEGEEGGPGGVAATGNAVLLSASFALTGHAAEASPRLLAEVLDGLHFAAAAVWIGGLAVLFTAYLPACLVGEEGALERARVLRRWSWIAIGAVAVLVNTGVYQGLRELSTPEALASTTYGQILAGKLMLVVAMLAAAGAARLVLGRLVGTSGASGAPGTSGGAGAPDRGGPGSVRRLRTIVAGEAAAGVLVLGVTAFLVATPPGRVTFGPPFSATVPGRDAEGTPVQVTLDVARTRVGPQSVTLRAATPSGQALRFTSATGVLRHGDDPPVRFGFTPVADGQGVARDVVVPVAGDWTLAVQIVTTPTTSYAASTTYQVR